MSKHKYAGGEFTKFAYHPKAKESLPVYPGEHHKYEILNNGNHPFDEYVTGIILRDYPKAKRYIAFRPCFPGKDVERNREEFPDGKERQIQLKTLSFDMQYSTMEALKHLGVTEWNYQFNAINRLSEEQTSVAQVEW